MANELTFDDLETNAGLAHYLAGLLQALLYDPTDLRSLMVQVPFEAGRGSPAAKVAQYSRDHIFTAATDEITGGGSNRDIGDASYQLEVARRYMKFAISDLWRLVAPTGSLDLDLLASIYVEATGRTLTDMLCALFPGLTANSAVGSTTGPMSVDVSDDAMFALNLARASSDLALVLSPKGYNEWFRSLSTLGGGRQFKQDVQGLLAASGPGLKGVMGNIQVYDSSAVRKDGGNTYYRQAMFARGCFAYQIAPAVQMMDLLPPNVFRVDAGQVLITHDYDHNNAVATSYGNFYPAVAEAEDARGVEIRSVA